MGNNKNKKNKFSEEFLNQLRYFMQDYSIKRINQSLRSVFFDYLLYQKEGFPIDSDDVISDISALFNLLDLADDEARKFRKEP